MASRVLNIAVVYGSTRSGRQGIKAARFITNKLKERNHVVTLVDPVELPLPFLDKMYKEYGEGEAPANMETIHKIFHAADAFVVVSGEWNHSIPAPLKNMLDHYQKEYLYKPSAIVTYSAGPFGGVRGIPNLRAIMSELGCSSIPSSFTVSSVYSSIDETGKAVEEAYDRRVVAFIDELEWYGSALKDRREKRYCSEHQPQQQEICSGNESSST